MLYWLSKAIEPLLWPLNLSLVLLALALIWRRKKRFTLAAFLLLMVASCPIFSLRLRYNWENTYPAIPFREYPERDAIVLLGGTMAPTKGPPFVPEEVNGSRVLSAYRLFKAGKAPVVLCSGGVPYQGVGGKERMEADDLCDLLIELGVPKDKQLRERLSRTTYENALYTREILMPQGKQKILLVTTAMHLKRATALYRKAGFDVTPVPTSWYIPSRLHAGDLLPDVMTLFGNTQFLKEVIGYYFFRLVGKASP